MLVYHIAIFGYWSAFGIKDKVVITYQMLLRKGEHCHYSRDWYIKTNDFLTILIVFFLSFLLVRIKFLKIFPKLFDKKNGPCML